MQTNRKPLTQLANQKGVPKTTYGTRAQQKVQPYRGTTFGMVWILMSACWSYNRFADKKAKSTWRWMIVGLFLCAVTIQAHTTDEQAHSGMDTTWLQYVTPLTCNAIDNVKRRIENEKGPLEYGRYLITNDTINPKRKTHTNAEHKMLANT